MFSGYVKRAEFPIILACDKKNSIQRASKPAPKFDAVLFNKFKYAFIKMRAGKGY